MPSLGFGHDAEFSVEKGIEKGRFAGGLRAKDRDKMIVKARLGDRGVLEVFRQISAADNVSIDLV